jgi:hypothetical protein
MGKLPRGNRSPCCAHPKVPQLRFLIRVGSHCYQRALESDLHPMRLARSVLPELATASGRVAVEY